MQGSFGGLLDYFVLCSFGAQTMGMVGKTVQLYRYFNTTVLIIDAHVNQTLHRMLQFVHTSAIACMAE